MPPTFVAAAPDKWEQLEAIKLRPGFFGDELGSDSLVAARKGSNCGLLVRVVSVRAHANSRLIVKYFWKLGAWTRSIWSVPPYYASEALAAPSN